jgi:hypothetical protein
MEQLINDIIESRGTNYFDFRFNSTNPVRHLKEQTEMVPNTPGLYLVYRKIGNDEDITNFLHLNYLIESEYYELLYFGKAGGITKNGKDIVQGLNGRINNVVSDSSRNLKDIKRAIYWNIIMNEFNFHEFRVIFSEQPNPQAFENIIYNFLDINNLKYPLMNKKRGR